jgi:hypothetical protein
MVSLTAILWLPTFLRGTNLSSHEPKFGDWAELIGSPK